jgi:hypothetical protein
LPLVKPIAPCAHANPGTVRASVSAEPSSDTTSNLWRRAPSAPQLTSWRVTSGASAAAGIGAPLRHASSFAASQGQRAALHSTISRSAKKRLAAYSQRSAPGSVASALPNSTAHSRRNALTCASSNTRGALSAAKRKMRSAAGAWLNAWRGNDGTTSLISDRGRNWGTA